MKMKKNIRIFRNLIAENTKIRSSSKIKVDKINNLYLNVNVNQKAPFSIMMLLLLHF